MSNKKIEKYLKFDRGSIWMCNFNAIYKTQVRHLQRDYRPVLIISNNKNNYYGKIVQVIPVTSGIRRYFPTHVKLKNDAGFNLDKDSILLVEGITSVEKSFLMNYVGKVDDIIMIEIEKALRIQHGLIDVFDSRHIFNLLETVNEVKTNEDLKIILNNNLKEYINEYRHEFNMFLMNERNKIQNMFNNKDYKNCIKDSMEMLNMCNILNESYDQWFYNFRISMCYHAIGKYNLSIEYCKNSIRYTINNDDTKYAECLWILSMCYIFIDNKKEALRYLNKCIKYYSKFNMLEHLSTVMYNKGKLLNNINDIKRALEIRVNNNFESNNIHLDKYYELLVELYSENDINKAMEYFNKINNDIIKERLINNYKILDKYEEYQNNIIKKGAI